MGGDEYRHLFPLIEAGGVFEEFTSDRDIGYAGGGLIPLSVPGVHEASDRHRTSILNPDRALGTSASNDRETVLPSGDHVGDFRAELHRDVSVLSNAWQYF